MKRTLLIGALCISFAVSALAQNLAMPEPLPDVPDVYVVKKGDTLWDIAGMFYGDPFTWPDIWNKNLYIEDPHWIYPGQELSMKDVLRLLTEPQPEPEAVVETPPAPEEVIEPLREPDPQFLEAAPRMARATSPEDANAMNREQDSSIIRVLPRPQPAYRTESFMRTGFISRRSQIPANRVIGIENDTRSATRHDIITIEIADDSRIDTGSLLSVLTVGERVKHPDTDEDMGVVMRMKGVAEVLSQDGRQFRCRIIENFDPIVTGDRALPASFAEAPEFDAWIRPDREINATILAVNEPMLSIHMNDILYLDKGSRDGIRPGDRFTLYDSEEGETAGHRTVLGEIQAVNVMPAETAVIVLNMSGEDIDIGDRAELTARCRLLY